MEKKKRSTYNPEIELAKGATLDAASYDKTQKFYLRKGFREVARVPDYYFLGNDRVTYCKKLL